MKVRDTNWGSIAYAVYISAIGVLALFVILLVAVMLAMTVISLSGCTQVIVTKPDGTRYQINTFFQKLDIGRLKTANLLLEGYSEEPGKAKVTVNPLQYEAEIGDDGK